MDIHQIFMHRCLQLAALGRGNVSPNPMVGAVLVHEGRIIGEGFHQRIGGPHAEVNAIASVAEQDKKYIPSSTLYVSLEPCNHFGKTPPCSDLILHSGIKKVVIGSLDPFEKVNGTGYMKLKAAGVDVMVGILEKEAKQLNARFFCNQLHHRPYIILKWAQTSNGVISADKREPMKISCELTNRMVHKWRSEEDAIAVGINTVISDDPQLNNRKWTGKSPVRVVFDPNGKMPAQSKVLQGNQKTIVFTHEEYESTEFVEYVQVGRNEDWLSQVLSILFQKGIGSLLVEGGAITHQRFIDAGLWDEARVIVSEKEYLSKNNDCVYAPQLKSENLIAEARIGTDVIRYYQNK